MKRRPITLTKQEATTLVNALGSGGYVYFGKMLTKLVERLRVRLDEDIPGTAAHAALVARSINDDDCTCCDDDCDCGCLGRCPARHLPSHQHAMAAATMEPK